MRLKLYRAANIADAMAQLRRELGPEALILSTRRVAEGVELTAALEPPDEPPNQPLPAQPILDCAYHGVPAALAVRLGAPDLAASLGAALRFGGLPGLAGGRLLMAGLPGAGKTLCVAKLATRLVLAGGRPLVITADGRRAGGAEELAAYTRLLGLTLLAASSPASLGRACAQVSAGASVLIDTAGINPHDGADMDGLAALMAAVGATPVLVMPAGAHPEEAAEQAAAFARLGIGHLLPTRLDLARQLGSVLAAADTGLVLTEAGVGTGATDGLVPITPEFLARRLTLRIDAPAPPPARLRAPVFPPARARLDQAWEDHRHG